MLFKSSSCPDSIMSCIKMKESKTIELTEEILFVTQNFGIKKLKKCVTHFY